MDDCGRLIIGKAATDRSQDRWWHERYGVEWQLFGVVLLRVAYVLLLDPSQLVATRRKATWASMTSRVWSRPVAFVRRQLPTVATERSQAEPSVRRWRRPTGLLVEWLGVRWAVDVVDDLCVWAGLPRLQASLQGLHPGRGDDEPVYGRQPLPQLPTGLLPHAAQPVYGRRGESLPHPAPPHRGGVSLTHPAQSVYGRRGGSLPYPAPPHRGGVSLTHPAQSVYGRRGESLPHPAPLHRGGVSLTPPHSQSMTDEVLTGKRLS